MAKAKCNGINRIKLEHRNNHDLNNNNMLATNIKKKRYVKNCLLPKNNIVNKTDNIELNNKTLEKTRIENKENNNIKIKTRHQNNN